MVVISIYFLGAKFSHFSAQSNMSQFWRGFFVLNDRSSVFVPRWGGHEATHEASELFQIKLMLVAAVPVVCRQGWSYGTSGRILQWDGLIISWDYRTIHLRCRIAWKSFSYAITDLATSMPAKSSVSSSLPPHDSHLTMAHPSMRTRWAGRRMTICCRAPASSPKWRACTTEEDEKARSAHTHPCIAN